MMRRFATALAILSLAAAISTQAAPSRATTGPLSGPPGVIETYAGGGTGGEGSPRLEVAISPFGVGVSPAHEVYFSALDGPRVYRITNNALERVAGALDQSAFTANDIGDGGLGIDAKLARPVGVTFAPDGDLIVGDSFDCAIRRIDVATSIITTIAGKGPIYCGGYSGDGLPAVDSQLMLPEAAAFGPDGTLFISDTRNCGIRKVVGGIISTVAGIDGVCTSDGDGGPASSAHIGEPYGLQVSANGDIFFASGSAMRTIRNGIIATVTGSNTSSQLHTSAVDSYGRIFVHEFDCGVAMIADGVKTSVVGPGLLQPCGFQGDGGLASQAETGLVTGLALDGAGNLFLATYAARDQELGQGRIRVIYGAAIDSDADGLTDSDEANAGTNPYTYCQTVRGDVNRDGVVNSGDQLRMVMNYGIPSTPRFDQNGDTKVNSGDLLHVALQFGKLVTSCP
jgi:sugar lactone lactonase YvrE